MVDVIGLRFVTEGEQDAIAAMRRYRKVKTETANAALQSISAFNRMQDSIRALHRGLDDGIVSGQSYARSLDEIKRQYAALSGSSIKKASEEVERFNRLLREQQATAKYEAVRQDFEQLVASLDPAAAAVQRFEKSMQRLNAAQDAGAVNSREYAAVQERLLEQLNDVTQAAKRQAEQGLDALRASYDPTVAAALRLKAAQEVVNRAVEQGVLTAEEGADEMRKYSAALNNTSKANELLRMKTEALARAYNPVLAAQIAYERQVEQLNEAQRYGVLTADQLEAKLGELRAAYEQVGSNSMRAQNFVNQFGVVTHIAGRSTNAFGMIAQQVGYQVGDFFVQVQSGTNAFVAFGQQATQLAGLLPGIYGAIIGIGISVGTMLLGMWDRTRRANDEATRSAERYAEALKSISQQTATTRSDLAALYAGFDTSEEGAIISQILEREREIRELPERIRAQFDIESLRSPFYNQNAVEQFIADVNEYIQEQIDLLTEANARDLERLETARRLREELSKLKAVTDRVEDLKQENALMEAQLAYMRQGVDMEEARRRAQEDALLRQAMALADSTIATEEQREAAERFVEELINGFNHARELESEMRTITEETESLARAARDAASAIDSIRGSTQNIAARIAGLTAELAAIGAGLNDPVVRASGIRAQRIAEARAAGESLRPGSSRLAAIEAEYEANVRLFELEERLREARRQESRSARGSSARSRELVTLESITQEMIRQASIQAELIRLSEEEARVRQIYYEIVERLRQQGVAYSEEAVMQAARRIDAERQVTAELERQQQITERLAGTMANLFMSAIRGADAFRQALANLLSRLAEVLAHRAFEELLSGMTRRGGGFLNILFDLFAANGAVLANGRPVMAFASGGIVGGPTMFPMRGGIGLVGEAGPEAIMPLRRGSDGKLGVASRVGVDVRVYVDRDGNWQAAVERIADSRAVEAATQIASRVAGRAIEQYDKALPARVSQINTRPRFR